MKQDIKKWLTRRYFMWIKILSFLEVLHYIIANTVPFFLLFSWLLSKHMAQWNNDINITNKHNVKDILFEIWWKSKENCTRKCKNQCLLTRQVVHCFSLSLKNTAYPISDKLWNVPNIRFKINISTIQKSKKFSSSRKNYQVALDLFLDQSMFCISGLRT